MSETEEPRAFAPLAPDHPAVGQACSGCDKELQAGDVITLVAIGPGDDEEQRQRARQGRPYTAVAVIAHYSCVTGKEAPNGD